MCQKGRLYCDSRKLTYRPLDLECPYHSAMCRGKAATIYNQLARENTCCTHHAAEACYNSIITLKHLHQVSSEDHQVLSWVRVSSCTHLCTPCTTVCAAWCVARTTSSDGAEQFPPRWLCTQIATFNRDVSAKLNDGCIYTVVSHLLRYCWDKKKVSLSKYLVYISNAL